MIREEKVIFSSVKPPGRGLTRQYRALSRALKIEKLKPRYSTAPMKNIPFHIMAELKSIPILPVHPRTHLYRK